MEEPKDPQKEERFKEFKERIDKLEAFAKANDIFISAAQRLNDEGYLITIPTYTNLKK